MDISIFLIVSAFVFAAVWLILAKHVDEDVSDLEESQGPRLQSLVTQLTGDVIHDRPINNQILALGPRGIPTLLNELTRRRQDGEVEHRHVIRAIEDLVVCFGLSGIPKLNQHFARLQATTTCSPSVIRIMKRIGSVGAAAAFRYGLKHTASQPSLHHCVRSLKSDELVSLLISVDDSQLIAALDLSVGPIVGDETIIRGLWSASSVHRRVMILRWLKDWLPACRHDYVMTALHDVNHTIREEAADLAELMPHPHFIAGLQDMLNSPLLSRRAAIRALCVQEPDSVNKDLVQAALDVDLDIASLALVRLIEISRDEPGLDWVLGDGFVDTPLAALRFKGLTSVADIPTDALIAMLEDDRPSWQYLAAHILAFKSANDPRARERLIRMADGHTLERKSIAIHALAVVNDRTSADLLVKCLRSCDSIEHQQILQRAAQRIGPTVAPMIARRLNRASGANARVALSILRSLPFDSGVSSLLHALEECSERDVHFAMSNTLQIGNDDVRRAIELALVESERGLVIPAVQFMADFPRPADLPLVMRLYDQHPALRGMLLDLIETFGNDAIEALDERIQLGGDDIDLLPLESRLMLLKACIQDEEPM